jgi:hypothetical protein
VKPSHQKKPLPLDPAAVSTETRRRAIFAALVARQDQGVAVGLSRQ